MTLAFDPTRYAGEGMRRLVLDDGRQAVLKRRGEMPDDFFAAEARGLEALRDAGGLRVPEVFAYGAHWLLIEDLGEGLPAANFAEDAGAGLARQHLREGEAFGFVRDGWIGDTRQLNHRCDDGWRFYAEFRLLPQAQWACEAGLLDASRIRAIERICYQLPQWIPMQPPVLLHGDLWSGNLHCTDQGQPALIDAAAVHYGWAEAELAMLLLFGDPGPRFFAAYARHAPLDRGWRERVPLYNLYHLLNHLNLFGGGYAGAVDAVLRRYD